MSKSVLIIDTPTNCYECPCFMDVGWRCQCKMDINEDVHDGRPDWCPLKPYKDAIPVEWIEKWGRRNTWYYGNKDNVITMLLREWRCKQRVKQANEMLENWEKENEHKESD